MRVHFGVAGLRTGVGVAIHFGLVLILLTMGIPQVFRIRAQLATDHIPNSYEFVLLIALTPFVLSALVILALRSWLAGQRRWLIGADIIVILCAFTILVLYVFANDVPLVLMALSPSALLVAAVGQHRSGEGRHV